LKPTLRSAGLLVRAGWALLLLGACALLPAEPGAVATELAPGVYMVRGEAGEVGPDNLGRVGNAGFIVGPAGVLAIDSGTSYRHGLALLQAIHSVTEQPVRVLLLTHARQEFLFGAAAFRDQGVPVAMAPRAAALMAARCEGCLKELRRVLGEDEMRATMLLRPDRLLESADDEQALLAVTGRPLRLLRLGHASGPGDIALLDVGSATLFAGGLLDHGRIPDVQDSDLAGWSRALDELAGLPLRRVVPGHGPAAGPEVIATEQRYLAGLQQGASALLAAGAPLSEVADRLVLPEFASWDQYETIHRRNAAVIFLRLEHQQLLRRE
jgi:glyoxylase-like metal-dependent hydrolase (beta-lactamase superfamily II)